MTIGDGEPAGDLEFNADDQWRGWDAPLDRGPDAVPAHVENRRRARAGIRALILALSLATASIGWSAIVAALGTTVSRSGPTSPGGQTNQLVLQLHADQVALGVQLCVGTVFGIWAVVSGAKAVAHKDGPRRGWWAIALSIATPLLSVLVWAAIAVGR
jgi:hypothetical protein